MNRRSFINATLAAPAAAAATAAQVQAPAEGALRCGPNGVFRILAISDLHYTQKVDIHGIALTE